MTSPADSPPSGTVAEQPQQPAQAATAKGRYGPLVHLSRLDLAAAELGWQLPINGELYRLMPGPDRPDYSLMVLRRPLHFYPPAGFDLDRVEPGQQVPDRKGRPMVRVHALVVCARFVGQQLHPGMADLPVNFAHVIDNSLAHDERLDLAKLEYAGVGYLTEGHAERVAAPPKESPSTDVESTDVGSAGVGSAGVESAPGTDLVREAVAILRRGIEARRGAAVSRLSASLSLGDDHRVTALTGNADGAAPEPTDETFARLNEVFARLGEDPATAPVRGVRIRVGEGVEHIELTRS